MAGIFAMATAMLTPEFVENFDPEKLASTFVRVEREFDVKFNKLESSFAIVGNWQSIRKARTSLMKLITDENKTNSKNKSVDKKPDDKNNEVTKAVCVSTGLKNNKNLVKIAGNPKRGRHVKQNKSHPPVPDPVCFLQYQDQTYNSADSLDINSVLDDFEKSHQHKGSVTKEDLKKIFEKNKDQMGRPLESGIPKGAIIPSRKSVEKTSNAESPNSGPDNLNLQYVMYGEDFTSLSSPVVSTSESYNVNTATRSMDTALSQLTTLHNTPRDDNQNYFPMIENYNPQSFLNTPVSMSIASSTVCGLSQVESVNHHGNSTSHQLLDHATTQKLSVYSTHQDNLQLYISSQSSQTNKPIQSTMPNTPNNMDRKQPSTLLNGQCDFNITSTSLHNEVASVQTDLVSCSNSTGSDGQCQSTCDGVNITGMRSQQTNYKIELIENERGSQSSTSCNKQDSHVDSSVSVKDKEKNNKGNKSLTVNSKENPILKNPLHKSAGFDVSKESSNKDDKKNQSKKIRKTRQRKAEYKSSQSAAEKPSGVNTASIDIDNVNDIKDETISVSDSAPTEMHNKIYECTECDYQGNKKKRLVEHMGRVHGILPGGNVDTETSNSSYQCDQCDKAFVFEKDLNRHKKIVHHGQKFTCDVCNKSYKSKYVFDRHMATHAEGYIQPKFKCQICEREFTTKFSLSCHTKSEHLGVKKTYSCPLCSKTFSQIRSYRQHANVHAGIRPYTCEVCGKSFTYDKSLKEHRYMHDNIRRFSCTQCGKTFRQRTCLLIHQKTHKETKDNICSICGRAFTQKQSLLRHERIHSGEKPYMCRICCKTFGDIGVIRKHVMMAHKQSKESWKDSVFTEPRERSNHYIEGGPGYTPRELTSSYKPIKTDHPQEPMSTQRSDETVTVSQLATSNNSAGLTVTSEQLARSNVNTELEQYPQGMLTNFPAVYTMPTFTSSGNLENSMKPKSDNCVVDSTCLNTYNVSSNPSLQQFNFTSLSDQSPVISDSIFSNMERKMSLVNDEAYASQFLNIPVTLSKVQGVQTGEHNMNFQNVVSETIAVSEGTSSHSSVAVTTSNSWNYVGYPNSYYTPATFNQYPPPNNGT